MITTLAVEYLTSNADGLDTKTFITEPLTGSITGKVLKGRCTLTAKDRAVEITREGVWHGETFIPPAAIISVRIKEEGLPEKDEPSLSERYS